MQKAEENREKLLESRIQIAQKCSRRKEPLYQKSVSEKLEEKMDRASKKQIKNYLKKIRNCKDAF
jgi:hypothetical protein